MEFTHKEKQMLLWASFLALMAAGVGFVFRAMVPSLWAAEFSITDAQGCQFDTCGLQVLLTLNSKDPLKSIIVFPNPASDKIFIKASQYLSGFLKLYDAQGKLVAQIKFHGDSEIEVSQLPSGMYILQVESNGMKLTKKLIIENRF